MSMSRAWWVSSTRGAASSCSTALCGNELVFLLTRSERHWWSSDGLAAESGTDLWTVAAGRSRTGHPAAGTLEIARRCVRLGVPARRCRARSLFRQWHYRPRRPGTRVFLHRDRPGSRLPRTRTPPPCRIRGGGVRAGKSVAEVMTVADVAALPAVVDLMTAAQALRIGRTTAYALARDGEFPCPVLRAGGSIAPRPRGFCACWGRTRRSADIFVARASPRTVCSARIAATR